MSQARKRIGCKHAATHAAKAHAHDHLQRRQRPHRHRRTIPVWGPENRRKNSVASGSRCSYCLRHLWLFNSPQAPQPRTYPLRAIPAGYISISPSASNARFGCVIVFYLYPHSMLCPSNETPQLPHRAGSFDNWAGGAASILPMGSCEQKFSIIKPQRGIGYRVSRHGRCR